MKTKLLLGILLLAFALLSVITGVVWGVIPGKLAEFDTSHNDTLIEKNVSEAENTQLEAEVATKQDPYQSHRVAMVTQQLVARGIQDPRVLEAMRTVPRHCFVPSPLTDQAYSDKPLPIGYEQTISQPYIVALMTELACVTPESIVLDIGTGSGYQTAILAQICQQVYTIEIVPELTQAARRVWEQLGIANVTSKVDDGYAGWPAKAPFDAIIVAAAVPSEVPQPLLQQLADQGRLVIPVGVEQQSLEVYKRNKDTWTLEVNIPVRFVPMVGRAQQL